MLSAISFNLDQFKILSSDSQLYTLDDKFEICNKELKFSDRVGKNNEKKKNLVTCIFCFP